MSRCKKILLWVLSVLCMLFFLMFSAEANLTYVLAGMLNGNLGNVNSGNIIFTRDSGFYEESFALHIFAPTKEVYYTLDGSDPDKDSIKYERAIQIEDASNNENVYSSRTDVTTAFLKEEIAQYCKEGIGIDYQVPATKVDKCTTIKVVYYDKDGNPSEIEERNYFVAYQNKAGYDNVNVISIVTDPENLFGYDTGIYVQGKTYDEEFGQMPDEEFAKKYWYFWPANYRNEGRAWEREAHIQIFDEEKNLVISQNAGIRIQGGGSRGFLPKSLNIYAREEYGENRFQYDFWDTGYYPKRMTLFGGGDDYCTKIKDRLISELVKGTKIATMNYKPYVLFLNGEYWGFYYLTEKYDEHFIDYYYHADKENTVMIKNGEVAAGTEDESSLSYEAMMSYILEHDLQEEENYQKVCEMLDIESFIDYFAIEAYIARRGDWPKDNFALWRYKDSTDEPYKDGKWRWMLFDVNSLGMDWEDYDSIEALRRKSELFNSMCENESFRRAFAKRWLEIADTFFDKELVNQKLDEYIQLMDAPMENHFQRFFGTDNERFYEEIENLRYFFNERKPYVVESIRVNFGEDYL